ncbi:sensor histidine kinase [Cellulomonas palmilytica]|uniref:sensor histidine kinase n=1 Tax=Cellulomonas palmilytica TaxID=2608402 RepID=UPI001F2E1B0F|nr:sensor histidine kinase [Cellulomonas palmilytica]UJP39569.1 sensor histidine kinase [Cellulomonas palmilytica]
MSTWDRLLRWEDSHRFVVDTIGAVLFFLALGPLSLVTAVGIATVDSTFVWSVLLTAPLAWRRVRPVGSAASVYAVGLAQLVVAPAVLPADLAVLVALYSVTVHGPVWAHRAAIGCALAAGVMLPLRLVADVNAPVVTVAALLIGTSSLTVWAFGLVRRSRRETLEALVDRAVRLEKERDQQAQLATQAERSRIAREMHDIVAHSLSVVIAQADGGRYAAESDPSAAGRALETIAETGRAALTDMRRLLGVLRSEPDGRLRAADGPGVLQEAPLTETAPQPGESEIPRLVDQVRASGAHVSLVRMGEPRPLPPGVGLAVYRITQEALTNVLKHAGPAPRVTVVVQWRPDAIELDVTDDGRGASAGTDGLGQGLRGMHERATMFGGSVTAGPRPGGGYRVRARLPFPDHRPRGSAPDA